ncbi:hypothetical protein TWF679_009967 [Orbilia oligospora]|uniref:non-specific serine/threonine protein kinase n=1 Tax=Orbilia oligospora TaxID=2813651 RepID=A0A8H8V1P6_ORBOL|nr:hypothetical protein TWF679_009967 [Orbilia oligospora]
MPAALHKPKKYGTARRSGTLTKAFRGSARAWDSQRKPQGLLMQQPTPQHHDDDDDSDDSFELESPPESPLAERVASIQTTTAVSPVKRLPIRPASPPTPIQDSSCAVPVDLAPRQPLTQKRVNHLNQLPSTPKNRKSYARRESNRVTKAEEVTVCQSIAIEAKVVENKEVTAIETQQEEVVIIDREEDDLPSPEQTSIKVRETFAVEIISSRRSITPSIVSNDIESQGEEEEEGGQSEGAEAMGFESDEDVEEEEEDEEEEEEEEDDFQEIEEYDETVFLSPEKRGELHNEARRRGRAQGPALALNDPLITGITALNLHSPSITPTTSSGQDTTPTPKTEKKKPKGLITPPPDEIPALHADSKVFTLLPACDQQRIVSYTEYLQTISADFSHIKKIGESSFAEVYIHKRDDGRSVVLKLVPLAQENNATEVLQELKTTRALSPIPGFIKYLGCQVVCSRVPPELEAAWRVWEVKNNERYSPTDRVFGDTTYHAIIALEDGGCSLDEARWSTWDVPLEIFRQTIKAFAQAEREREFEHRDLHLGNILVRDLKKEREGRIGEDTGVGRDLEITHAGFEDVVVTMIDYTLSRAKIPEEFGGGVAYMDMEEGMFDVFGLYQFDMYRMVRDEVLQVAANAAGNGKNGGRRSERINKPDWTLHCPRSNVIWLHFLIKRLIRSDDGRRNDGKLRIWKPSKAKKNQFDLACWGQVMKIHEVLDREVDEEWKFSGAVDIERWCEEEGLFEILDQERERRRSESGEVIKEKVEVVVSKEKTKEVVRRSQRLRK